MQKIVMMGWLPSSIASCWYLSAYVHSFLCIDCIYIIFSYHILLQHAQFDLTAFILIFVIEGIQGHHLACGVAASTQVPETGVPPHDPVLGPGSRITAKIR